MGLFDKEDKKSIVDRELELYKREKQLEIDKELADYKKSTYQEVQDLAVNCANDTKNLEHEYHYNQEQLGKDIAKLEAKKEYLEELVNTDKVAYERILKDKDAEIDKLNKIIHKLIENQPQGVVQIKEK